MAVEDKEDERGVDDYCHGNSEDSLYKGHSSIGFHHLVANGKGGFHAGLVICWRSSSRGSRCDTAKRRAGIEGLRLRRRYGHGECIMCVARLIIFREHAGLCVCE